MKTAVSIPDPLFRAADDEARRRKLSRSQLYAHALELLLSSGDEVSITARIDGVRDIDGSQIDPAVAGAQSRAIAEAW